MPSKAPPSNPSKFRHARSDDAVFLDGRTASSSCTQCNRAFCLSNTLPICKGAEEKDVLTMCFQRDSRKDQIIVWTFILGTAGLVGWAGLRRVLEMRQVKGLALPGPLGGGAGGTAGGDGAVIGATRSRSPRLQRRAPGAARSGGESEAARGMYNPLESADSTEPGPG
jgi:hypothetical protein